MKSVAFDDTGKTSPFAQTCDIHDISRFEEVEGDFLPKSTPSTDSRRNSLKNWDEPTPAFLKCPERGLLTPLALWKETELKGIITILSLVFF